MSYQDVVKHALDAKIDALEIRLHNGNRFFDLPMEEVPAAVEYLRKHNVHVVDLGTNLDLCYYDEGLIAEGKRCVDLAVMTQAKGIRVFLGTFIKRFSEESFHNYQDVVKMLQALCTYGSEKGIEIWVETHNAFSTGKVLKKVIEDVDCENLKVIWDVMHPYEFAETPGETLALLGERIAHVHIKDGDRKEDPDLLLCRYTKLGEGTVPVPEIVSLLEKAGYDGYYSLEWESEWRAEIKDTFASLPEILAHFNDYMKKFGA